jgi:O-antigen/teichoic acid export membrane protein
MVWLWGFTGWIAGRWAADVLAVLTGLPYVLSRLRARPDPQYLRPFLSFSGYATLTLALSTLLTGIDVLCLVHFHADPEIIAHYKVATYIFNTALLLPITFIQARYSKMVAYAFDPRRTWQALWWNTGVLMALVVPAAVAGYFMAPVLPMIFGEGYTASIQIFRWLLPAFIIHSAGKLSSNLVVGAGLMRAQLWTSVATLAMNAALNIALIPSMGVAGAVIATTASLALKTGLSPWILSRYRAGVAPGGKV